MIRKRATLIVAFGAALAVMVTLSPVAVLGIVVLGAIMIAAARGLTSVERHTISIMLLVSVAVRLLAIVALLLSADPYHLTTFPFEGDGWFLKQRALWIRNVWLGVPIDQTAYANALGEYGWTSYINIIAYLQYLLSPAPYAIHVFNVCCSIGAAVLLHRLVRWAYGSVAALIALGLLLFLPTQFLWSVSALKEPLFVLLLVCVLGSVAVAGAGCGVTTRVCALAIAIAAALSVDSVRQGAQAIIALAVLIGLVGTFVIRRPYILLLVVLLGPIAVSRALDVPAVQARVLPQLRTGASLHIGHVRTEGHGVKMLDQRFYTFTPGEATDPVRTMTWAEAERFAVRALSSFWIVPIPAQVSSRSELLVLPQQLVWYALLLLAVIGIGEGSMRHPLVTWLLIGMSCAGATAVAMNSGNIGTLVRHRDGFVPFVVCLSAVGAASLLRRAPLFGGARACEPERRPIPAETPVHDAGFIRRAVESSAVIRSGKAALSGSVVFAAVTAFFRPTLGYSRNHATSEDASDLLLRLASTSVLIAALRHVLDRVARAWDDSAIGTAVQQLWDYPLDEQIRLTGLMLLLSTLTAGMLAPFGDYSWPALFPWAVAMLISATLTFGASRIAAEWRQRHPQPRVSTSSERAPMAVHQELTAAT
jgi:hypothetical protein